MEKITAHQLFKKVFTPLRDPRSKEYKLGALTCLQFQLGERETIPQHYVAGTAQADAYSAGIREGHEIFRHYKAKLPH